MHLCGLAFLNSEPGSEAQDSGQRRGRAPAPEKAKFVEFSSPPSVGGGVESKQQQQWLRAPRQRSN